MLYHRSMQKNKNRRYKMVDSNRIREINIIKMVGSNRILEIKIKMLEGKRILNRFNNKKNKDKSSNKNMKKNGRILILKWKKEILKENQLTNGIKSHRIKKTFRQYQQ